MGMEDRNRPGVLCWRCGSYERHRALWICLTRDPDLLASTSTMLHLAPEHCLRARLTALVGHGYRAGDLSPWRGDLRIDLTAVALPDASFDAVLCSHVLEHVDDDRAAMRELHRIVRPGGLAIVMVPLDPTRAITHEDPAIVTPAEREREYWQHDHVRLYGCDFVDRLAEAGFDVTARRIDAEVGEVAATRHGLSEADTLFLCRR